MLVEYSVAAAAVRKFIRKWSIASGLFGADHEQVLKTCDERLPQISRRLLQEPLYAWSLGLGDELKVVLRVMGLIPADKRMKFEGVWMRPVTSYPEIHTSFEEKAWRAIVAGGQWFPNS